MMKRRLVEIGLLLALVATLLMAKRPEAPVSLDELTIDGLYPGMPVSEIEVESLRPTTVFETGVTAWGISVHVIYGEVLVLGEEPFLDAGDSMQQVEAKLGAPTKIDGEIWRYSDKFSLCFRNGRLFRVFASVPQQTYREDYYYIECDGWSHSPPNLFYALTGKTRDFGGTLLVLNGLEKRNRFTTWSGQRLELAQSSLSVGDSLTKVKEELRTQDVTVPGNVWTFVTQGVEVALNFQQGKLNEIAVQGVFQGPSYESIESLIETPPKPEHHRPASRRAASPQAR